MVSLSREKVNTNDEFLICISYLNAWTKIMSENSCRFTNDFRTDILKSFLKNIKDFNVNLNACS